MVILLIALALEDAILTLACVSSGASEANPLMALCLRAAGAGTFVASKLLVVTLGAAFLRRRAPRALAFLCGAYFTACLASLVALYGGR